MEFENDFSLKEWAKDKPLSILQLDPADRAVLRIAGCIKHVSLVLLTLQNAVLGLSMWYARTRDVEFMFSPAAAVLMAEILKLIISGCLVMLESGGVQKGARSMYNIVILNVRNTLILCVPSYPYIVQNYLLYVSASNSDAASYQVTYPLKILTTAFFAVLLWKRHLKEWQWLALAILAGGVTLVQLCPMENANVFFPHLIKESKILGFSAALAASFISGFAGIYYEKVLKKSEISVWMRNVQLSSISLPFGTISYLISEGTQNHLLIGFDGFVWSLVLLQAAGGLIVAMVAKYADSILKVFATSVAIIISRIASIYIFDCYITVQFAVGTVFVIVSVFLYGYLSRKSEPRYLSDTRIY